MSASLISTLLQANNKIIAYGGISIFLLGVVGNVLNVTVFLSLKTFRESSCAFYLTVLSIVNIGQLFTSLLTRIMITAFNIDWTQSSLIYCKFRSFAFQTTSMISFSCISLATIDQYFETCSRVQWHRWGHIRIAHRATIIAIVIAILLQSPCIFLYDHVKVPTTNTVVCTTVSDQFVSFNTYFNYLFLGNIAPYSITFTFGLLAYHNIKEINYRTVPLVRRELDKQLTIMVLIQIVYTFISLSPNMILYIILAYGNVRNPIIVASLQLVYAVTLCLYYSYFAVSISFSMKTLLIFEDTVFLI